MFSIYFIDDNTITTKTTDSIYAANMMAYIAVRNKDCHTATITTTVNGNIIKTYKH